MNCNPMIAGQKCPERFERTRAGLPVVVLLVVAATGCRAINKHVTEAVLDAGEAKQWQIHYDSTHRYQLNDRWLERIAFEGTIPGKRISVRYQRGLADPAQHLTDRAVALIEQVEQRTGVAITTHSTIDLLRFDEPPQNFSVRLTVEPNEFPLPMFVRTGEESYPAILARNRSYPYLFIHELVETSLVSGQANGRVLPDLGWGALGLTAHLNNYTRWFRDGLANYAGYVAYEIVAQDLADAGVTPTADPILHTQPFSALSRIRGKLFSWPQSAPENQQRAYYDAALGLFLLLEHQFGEPTIRQIMTEIATRDPVDRRDLVAIVNETIGTDIKRLVADFQFPGVGLELARITPALMLNEGLDVGKGLFVDFVEPNSLSGQAGLQRTDAIVAVGGSPVAGQLDFELALLQAMDEPTVPLTLSRRGMGVIVTELPLQPVGHAPVGPGKRRDPLHQGQIDFLRFLPLIP